MRERRLHCLQFRDLPLDLVEMTLGQPLHVGTGPAAVFPQREQRAAFLDREAERACAPEKGQLVQIVLAEPAIAVRIAHRPNEADLLVIADRLGRQPRPLSRFLDVHAGFLRSLFRPRTGTAASCPLPLCPAGLCPPSGSRAAADRSAARSSVRDGHALRHARASAAGARRRRSAFVSTKTDEKAIAPAASIGESCGPPNGTSTPAATGISATL